MKKYLNIIMHDRGEGVILRKPLSSYQKGKSYDLLKAKVGGPLIFLAFL